MQFERAIETMGQPNRVEELEQRVRELEASVAGLTDELLECRQSLEEVEAQTETDKTDTDTIPEDESEENPESEIIIA